MKNKSGFFHKLFYSNKFIMVFSLLLSIILWATVKVNFSDNSTRTISDVKVTINETLSAETDFVPFVNLDDLYVDVMVSGKSYNINSYSLSRSDIVVEANTGYIDAAGYKVLNLTARAADGDVSVTGISPSTITVFFDRKLSSTFNVEAKLTNDIESLSSSDYLFGQPVASMSTIEVSGPATVVERIKKVYFEATLKEEDLPLTETTQVVANVSYALENERGSHFLECKGIEDQVNPATVTIPVSKVKNVSTAVKFVNEPAIYEQQSPKVTISPSNIKISYNPQDGEDYETFNVGTIDFRQLTNGVNKFEFKHDEKTVVNIIDGNDIVFKVTVDMSGMSKKVFDEIPGKVVTLNQSKDYNYEISLDGGGLDEITVIGPKKSLDKISVDDLQIEINVSSLHSDPTKLQEVEISNISISNKEINDCWIYGKYHAKVRVSEK